MKFELSETLIKQGLEIVVHSILNSKNGEAVNIETAHSYIESLIEEIEKFHKKNDRGVITRVTINDPEHYPIAHALNVTVYSLMFAVHLGIESYSLRDIGLGAIFHDIGKINTPDDLYWKQFGENDYEKTTIAEHPMFGAHFLKSSTLISKTVTRIIHEHHEFYDGSGYPKGLTDADQINDVRIVVICNYFDNLISGYRGMNPISENRALLEIIGLSGRYFNPRITSKFVSEMTPHIIDGPIYPPGTLVLLSSGEVASVISSSNLTDVKPDVYIVADNKKQKLARPQKVELKKDSSRQIAAIIK